MTITKPPPPGTKPTAHHIIATRDRMVAEDRLKLGQTGTRPVMRELMREGFTVSRATVQRLLERNAIKLPPPPPTEAELAALDPKLIPSIGELLRDNSTRDLVQLENRTRMALNIILARSIAANKEIVLADMKAAASLVEALTKSAKIGHGTTVDIHLPTHAINGTVMKDITPPKSDLAHEIELWQAARPKSVHVKIA